MGEATQQRASLGLFDASRRMDVTPNTLQKWSVAGKIEFFFDETGHRRYPVDVVERIALERRRNKPPRRYRCVLAMADEDYATAFTSDGWSVYTVSPSDIPNLCRIVAKSEPELVILRACSDSETSRIAETLQRNPVKNLWLVLSQGYAPQRCRAIRPGESPETLASLAAAEFAIFSELSQG